MLSGKIDLTEHRDFGSNTANRIRIRQYLDRFEPDMDVLFMREDDYIKKVQKERIFGRRTHINRMHIIFNYEEKHEAYWRETCARCGRPLRCPWHIYGNVCRECDIELEENRVPWKKYYISGGRSDANDLFNLR